MTMILLRLMMSCVNINARQVITLMERASNLQHKLLVDVVVQHNVVDCKAYFSSVMFIAYNLSFYVRITA